MFLAYVINKHPLSLSGLLWSGHIMCNPPSCQAPRDLTSASLPSSLPMFALLTWGQHSPLLLLLWRHRTCYYLKTFALHQWLSPQIFAWFVTSCHSRLTSPERYLIYWSPHLKWPTPPALLLLHLVLFPLFYITVWNHSLFIYVFTLFNVCLSLCLSYSFMTTNSRKARLHLFCSNHTHGGCQPSLADSCYTHDLFIEWWITKISNFFIQGCCCQCSSWGSKAVNTQFGKKKLETELKF